LVSAMKVITTLMSKHTKGQIRMPQTNQHKKLLTNDDERIIRECKIEREKLRFQASQLSDRSLAKKFCVSHRTISRV